MAIPIRPIDGPQTDEPEPLWNRFARQRLKSWQPILAPRQVISCYIASGVVFLSVGIVLLLGSQSVEEYRVDYTDFSVDRHGVGSFDINVERDMEPPIWVYYQLDGFHQNHRRYIKSRSNKQLLENDSPPQIRDSDLVECEPWITTDERVNYPCGVVARSIFNDTFVLQIREPQEDSAWKRVAVDSRASTIAWSEDLKERFLNLPPEAHMHQQTENQVLLNMWILQQFPPLVCEQEHIDASANEPYVPVTVAMRKAHWNSTVQRQVDVTDCRDYFGQPRCNYTRDGKPFECTGDYREVRVDDWGIESGHFIVWMRVAGLPNFMKLWGRIDRTIKAGSTIKVHYVDNFPVKPYYARKALVLSTASVLADRNNFLGLGYLSVGGCCLVFGFAFLWRHLVKPRPLGDVSLLCRDLRPSQEPALRDK